MLRHWQDHHCQNHLYNRKGKHRPTHILAPEISEESCVIDGLFQDIGKVGMSGKPHYLPEIKDEKPTGNLFHKP
jgi:hypothetical protein